jgi:hypothetical protein
MRFQQDIPGLSIERFFLFGSIRSKAKIIIRFAWKGILLVTYSVAVSCAFHVLVLFWKDRVARGT